MKFASRAVAVLAVLVVVAVVAQHLRYLEIRREIVQDRQPIAYSGSAFHVVTLLALAPDQALLPAVGGFVEASEAAGATVVYAGAVAVVVIESRQIPPRDWDAVVVAQYPSREAWDEVASDPIHRRLRETFSASYAMGMVRPPWLNAAIPAALLGVRASDIARGTPSRLPFTRADEGDMPEFVRENRARVVERLLAQAEYGADAVVVVNFIQHGSAVESDANAEYGRAMVSLMAEQGYGPMHAGRAVVMEGEAAFDEVVMIDYPGVRFFAEMFESTFFAAIIEGKQLGDSLSAVTVPLLAHLPAHGPVDSTRPASPGH